MQVYHIDNLSLEKSYLCTKIIDHRNKYQNKNKTQNGNKIAQIMEKATY